MKLKGIELKGTYKVEFYDKSFYVYDERGNNIYLESSNGYWAKSKCDSQGNRIHFEDSVGYWAKQEFDDRGKRVYFEDSDGCIIDERVKKN